MGVVNRQQRREEKSLRVFEVLMRIVLDVLRSEAHAAEQYSDSTRGLVACPRQLCSGFRARPGRPPARVPRRDPGGKARRREYREYLRKKPRRHPGVPNAAAALGWRRMPRAKALYKYADRPEVGF